MLGLIFTALAWKCCGGLYQALVESYLPPLHLWVPLFLVLIAKKAEGGEGGRLCPLLLFYDITGKLSILLREFWPLFVSFCFLFPVHLSQGTHHL